jgi:ankyrin repeat protein
MLASRWRHLWPSSVVPHEIHPGMTSDSYLKLVSAALVLSCSVSLSGCNRSVDGDLLRSLRAKNWERYVMLLRNGADPNVLDGRGSAAVLDSAEETDPKWLREALRHGGNPNLVNVGSRISPDSTPLFYSIGLHRPENVRLLIAAGADVNHLDHDHSSPFYEAVCDGDYESATLLLEAGADFRVKTSDGDDAVEHLRKLANSTGWDAARKSDAKWFPKLIELLNSKGANIKLPR